MEHRSSGNVPSSSADCEAPSDRSAARTRILARSGADVSALVAPGAGASAVERANAHERQLLATAAAAGIRRRDPMHPVVSGIAATPAIVVAAVNETTVPLIQSVDAVAHALRGIHAGLATVEAEHRALCQELRQMRGSQERNIAALAGALAANRQLLIGAESAVSRMWLWILVGAVMQVSAALLVGLTYLLIIGIS